jgi:hypothetical protein
MTYERVDSEFACRGDGDLHFRDCLGPSDFRSDPRLRLIALPQVGSRIFAAGGAATTVNFK